MTDLPLSGVRVVEFSTMITASLATMLLAEQGADVIKVEPEMGDPMRRIGSQRPGMSALFANFNKGKRSVVLDLKTEDDIALARSLCESADVIVSNYRPSVMARLGLSYGTLKAANPKLVFARITGFGSDGPQADSPAYDHVMQAQLGYTVAQGKNGDPVHMQTAVCDKVTGLMASQAISSALFAAARTGQGSRIDLSMMDAGMHFLFPDTLMDHTILSKDAIHLANLAASYGILEAKDGHFVIAALGDQQWDVIFKMIGRPEMNDDPRFNSMVARMADYRGLLAEISKAPLSMTVDQALSHLSENGIPCARCQSPRAALDDPQLLASGTVQTVDDPFLGPIRSVRPAAIFNGVKASADKPAPTLGAHTRAVREKGWS